SGSFAATGWWKPIDTWSCDTGASQTDLEKSTENGCAIVYAPLVRWFGPDTDSVASPPVESTSAVTEASEVLATPGATEPNAADRPPDGASVAGPVPPAVPCLTSSRLQSFCLKTVSV